MASLVLSQASTSLLAPSLYGFMAEGATVAASGALWAAAQGITGALGSIAGSVLDRLLFSHDQDYYGPRLNDLTVQTSTEGASLPIVYGTMRLAGNVIWSTGLEEIATTTEQGGGSGGGGASSTTYSYRTDCAVAVCEGTITGIKRIWADTKLIYDVGGTASVETLMASGRNDIRFYTGSETQLCDTLTQAVTGSDLAYRGTAYVVFENLELANFGNRLPNFSFEVVKSGSLSTLLLNGSITLTNKSSSCEAPFADAKGLYFWSVDNWITNATEISHYLIPHGTSSAIRLNSFIVPLSDVSYPYAGRGESDQDLMVLPTKVGGKRGVMVVYPNGSSKEIIPYTSANSSWTEYTVRKGKLYVGLGIGSSIFIFCVNLTTELITEFTLPFTPYPDWNVRWMSASDTYLYVSAKDNLGNTPRVVRYLLSDLSLVDNVTFASLMPLGSSYQASVTVDDILLSSQSSRLWGYNYKSGQTIDYGAITASGSTNDYTHIYSLSNGTVFLIYDSSGSVSVFSESIKWYTFGVPAQTAETLKSVCEQILDYKVSTTNLPILLSTKYDMTALASGNVRGYIISKQMPIKDALEPLTAAYAFDIIEEDSKIVAKPYSSSNTSIRTLATQEVGTYNYD